MSASGFSEPPLLASTHRRGLCWAKKAPGPGAAESRSLGTGGEGWRRPLPFAGRVSGLTRWVSRHLFIVLVAKCYIKGREGLNEFRPSAVSCVVAPGMEACERTSPGGPACLGLSL